MLKLERGDLNGGHTAISNQTLEQDWTLDKTGNWKSFTQDAPGTTDDVAQTRTSNEDNQITAITTTVGTTWPTPVYDDAGNMLQMPSAANVGSTRSVQYDPWGRLTYASATPGATAGSS